MDNMQMKKQGVLDLANLAMQAAPYVSAAVPAALAAGKYTALGLGSHLGVNLLGRHVHHNSNLQDVLAHIGIQHGLSESQVNPAMLKSLELVLGPETMMTYRQAREIGGQLSQLPPDVRAGVVEKLSKVPDLHPGLGNAPVYGPIARALGHEHAGTTPEFQGDKISKAYHGALTRIMGSTTQTPFDTSLQRGAKWVAGAAPLTGVAGLEMVHSGHPGMLAAELAPNVFRDVASRTSTGKQFMENLFKRGLSGKTISSRSELATDLLASPAALDTQRLGKILHDAGLGGTAVQVQSAFDALEGLKKVDQNRSRSVEMAPAYQTGEMYGRIAAGKPLTGQGQQVEVPLSYSSVVQRVRDQIEALPEASRAKAHEALDRLHPALGQQVGQVVGDRLQEYAGTRAGRAQEQIEQGIQGVEKAPGRVMGQAASNISSPTLRSVVAPMTPYAQELADSYTAPYANRARQVTQQLGGTVQRGVGTIAQATGQAVGDVHTAVTSNAMRGGHDVIDQAHPAVRDWWQRSGAAQTRAGFEDTLSRFPKAQQAYEAARTDYGRLRTNPDAYIQERVGQGIEAVRQNTPNVVQNIYDTARRARENVPRVAAGASQTMNRTADAVQRAAPRITERLGDAHSMSTEVEKLHPGMVLPMTRVQENLQRASSAVANAPAYIRRQENWVPSAVQSAVQQGAGHIQGNVNKAVHEYGQGLTAAAPRFLEGFASQAPEALASPAKAIAKPISTALPRFSLSNLLGHVGIKY